MARLPYNGFTADERNHISWLYRQRVKQGLLTPRPKTACDACQQVDGAIEGHREDYSSVDPAGIVVVCYRCHRLIHLRAKYPQAWDDYREAIRRGYRWAPTRSIGAIMSEHIRGRSLLAASRCNPACDRTILDRIHDGELLPDTAELRAQRLACLLDEYWAAKRGAAATARLPF